MAAASRVARAADGSLSLTLHTTTIASLSGEVLTLNTGGWNTPTTRRWMNHFLAECVRNASVRQHAGILYFHINDYKVPFTGPCIQYNLRTSVLDPDPFPAMQTN